MDTLKLFTQVLPLLLPKLEIIRQVLEAHGLNPKKADLEEKGGSIRWALKRGDYKLCVAVHLDWDSDKGAIVLDIRREGGWLYPSLAIMNREEQWYAWHLGNDDMRLSREEYREQGWNEEDLDEAWPWVQPLADLWNSLPYSDLDSDFYSEAVAREAMGMIAAFFAKLPGDPPKSS